MRITHSMITRNYLKRMDTNLTNLVKSNEKMASGRAFNKGYEDVSSAGKALKVRNLIYENERQLTTIRDAKGRTESAENGMRAVNTILIKAEDLTVEAMNGTFSESDREKIASELEKYQEEIFQIMNSTYSGKYLYNAAGNRTGQQPFTKDEGGALIYNGYYVDNLQKNMATGEISEYNSETGEYTPLQYDVPNYVDIGYGFAIGDNGKVNPNTGFEDTFSGIESFGYGTNEDGVPKNAYGLLGSMVNHLRANNIEDLGKDLNAISDSMEFLLTSITEVGARNVSLEQTGGRIEEELITLQERQNQLEGVDLSHEIIYNKTFERSWMVTLQMGSKILPTSMFDFLR